MSQLNNDDNNIPEDAVEIEEVSEIKEKNKKNKNSISKEKRLIIFTILFSLLCVLSTITAIFFSNKNQENKNDNQSDVGSGVVKNSESELALKSLTEKYLPNALKVERVEYKEGEYKIQGSTVSDYKVYIVYSKISGLKDKNIEDKINKEIKDKAFEVYSEKYNKNDPSISSIVVNSAVYGNFSNVLSVGISYDITYNKNGQNSYDNYDYQGLNYRLDTGDKISFNDLFISSANINNIIADSKYIQLAWDEMDNTLEGVDMNNVDTSKFEEKIVSFVNEFSKNKNPEFYFAQNKIYVKVGNENEFLPIDIAKYYNSIAIFRRYSSNKNLFETSDNKVNEVFVFNAHVNNPYVYEDIYSNLFVDATVLESGYNENAEVYKKIKIKINELIEDAKAKSLANKNIGTAFRVYAYTSYNQNDNKINAFYEIYENTMAIDYFKNNIYSLIAEYERKPKASVGGNYFEKFEWYNGDSELINNSKITVKEEYIDEYYDLSGNIIKDNKTSNNTSDNNSNTNNEVNIYVGN